MRSSKFARLVALILTILPLGGCAGSSCGCLGGGASATMCDLEGPRSSSTSFRPLAGLSRCLERIGFCRQHGRSPWADHADCPQCLGYDSAVVGSAGVSVLTTGSVQPHATSSVVAPVPVTTTTMGQGPLRDDAVRPSIPSPPPSPVASATKFDLAEPAVTARRRLVALPQPAPQTVFRLPAPPKSAVFAEEDQRDRGGMFHPGSDVATTSPASSSVPMRREDRSDSPPAPSRFEVAPPPATLPAFDQAEPVESSRDDWSSAPTRFGFKPRRSTGPAQCEPSDMISKHLRIRRNELPLESETVALETTTRSI